MDKDHPIASSLNLDKIKSSADIIREISANEVYLGFCKQDTTGTDEEAWSILQIKTDSNSYPKVTTFKWAEGKCFYDLVFDAYASYTYKYKTF